ncbi:MAG: arginase family protein, partial [Myxococcota bacterium]
GPLCVVHFDAHTDVYPPAWDCNVHHGTFMRLAHERGWLQPDGVLQIGVRGHFASAEDVQAPSKLGFRVMTTDDIQTGGLNKARQAIEQLPKGPTYVTFDIDCLDPAYAPGTGTPVPGGLSSWQAMQLLQHLASRHIVGGDVVEVAPAYDHGDITALAAASILWEMLALLAKKQ